jgi:predicted amidohydrolase YtcJ
VKPEEVDLEGKTVLPGFIDSHIHLLSFGLTLRDISLADVTSIEQIKAKVRAKADTVAEGQWILGRGWDQEVFAENRYPTRKDLDEASGGRPVFLTRACGHIAVASTKALGIAGITRDTQDPPEAQSTGMRTAIRPAFCVKALWSLYNPMYRL